LDTPSEKKVEKKRGFWSRIAIRKGTGEAVLLPVLSVFTALVIGAFVIPWSDPDFLAAKGFTQIVNTGWISIKEAYSAMFIGAFGDPKMIATAFETWRATGDTKELLSAFRSFSESLVIATPYIFAGLGVALGFRGGLFNIGAEGQLFAAGLATAFVGYSLSGLPFYIHMPLAILAGALAGALWGGIPGFLKARTGAHEVINTIMMNYIAFRLTDFLLSGPMMRADGLPITPEVHPTSYLPLIFDMPMRLHWGFVLALILAWIIYWFLWKTPLGFEIRMVGENPNASRYAGVKITFITVLTMALSGALAGMAGVGQILGVDHKLVRAFSAGYGFDAIALALLGNSHPFGVVLASLLFGFLRGGAARMQSIAGTPVELIRIIQGLVIIFIAAPEIIRSLYRLKPNPKKISVN